MRVLILYATFTGNTQLASEYLQKELPKVFLSHHFTLASIWQIQVTELPKFDAIIFGSSTWDDGVNPDTEEFLYKAKQNKLDLSPVPVALFGLGDSSYELFCGALPGVQKKLENFGAKIYSHIFTLDGFPTQEKLDPLKAWAKKFLLQL